jgi:sulfatase modifying factor 1
MRELTDEAGGLSMVRIPGGTVDLRDDRRGTRWQVDIAPFFLGRVPVTTGVHRAAVGTGVDPNTSNAQPVTNVSWLDAVDVCNRLSSRAGLAPAYVHATVNDDVTCDWAADGYRLPTDAEWQYACKAGTSGYRYGAIEEIAWYAGNSGGRIHDVGGKTPNAWGLFDMLGNVWEWCWDLYDPRVYGPYRVFRGGGADDRQWGCRASSRRKSHPTLRIDDLGFRLALPPGTARPSDMELVGRA